MGTSYAESAIRMELCILLSSNLFDSKTENSLSSSFTCLWLTPSFCPFLLFFYTHTYIIKNASFSSASSSLLPTWIGCFLKKFSRCFLSFLDFYLFFFSRTASKVWMLLLCCHSSNACSRSVRTLVNLILRLDHPHFDLSSLP